MRLCLLVFLVLLMAGCSSQPTMSVKDADSLASEAERVAKNLPETEAGQFRTAVRVLAAVTLSQAASVDDAPALLVARFNGKTPAAVIADYNKLDETTKMQVARGVLDQLGDALKQKELNEINSRVMAEHKRLEADNNGLPSIPLDDLYLKWKLDDIETGKAFLAAVEGKSLKQIVEEQKALKEK